jgi:hypothetical protein
MTLGPFIRQWHCPDGGHGAQPRHTAVGDLARGSGRSRALLPCVWPHGVAALLPGSCYPLPNGAAARGVAAIAMRSARLLVGGMEVGGEVLCPTRRAGCRHHHPQRWYGPHPQTGIHTPVRLFPGSTLCAPWNWCCHDVTRYSSTINDTPISVLMIVLIDGFAG